MENPIKPPFSYGFPMVFHHDFHGPNHGRRRRGPPIYEELGPSWVVPVGPAWLVTPGVPVVAVTAVENTTRNCGSGRGKNMEGRK